MRLVVDYGWVKKKTHNHPGNIPNMENTLERFAQCRFKTKMDKRSAFWQVDLTRAAQERLAFVTPKGRVFHGKVRPFGVANASATRRGFWFAHTCACSLYLFYKALADFPQLKMKSTQR